ncbi:SART-1 family protein DOT2-like isoform X2 [Salvia splendens]|uniref:SART-1 family protein DOT2-like isoform X2 n=1 Tax=Salvia splendens TaxID=180675 RepID=UPI001C2785BD|nr:SART-1 family protein DOT2-like isoform X2 [Salvia splendens]
MGADLADPTHRRSVERRDGGDNMRERWTGDYGGMGENESDDALESGKNRGKEKSKSSSRREEKDHRSRDRERSKVLDNIKENKDSEKDRSSTRDRRKEDRDEREKDKIRDKGQEQDSERDKHKEKERDKERRDRIKEKEREREREKEAEKDADRGRDKEKVKEKSRDKDRDKEKEKDRSKDKEREKHKDRDREREFARHRGKDTAEREKGKERDREKEKLAEQEKDRASDRDKSSRKQKDESKDGHSRFENDYSNNQTSKHQVDNSDAKSGSKSLDQTEKADNRESTSKLEQRISKMKEERLMKKSEGAPDILSWVNKSRKIEEKRNAEKEKALQLSRIFEEQDNMNDEGSDDESGTQDITQHLGGVKVLHGLDKVLEGGAVVLTLKDQSILADGDINEEVDMLENVEIGEQKRRDEAYRDSKKKVGVYDDKFNDEVGVEKKMLPQYDDPIADEGLTLDSSGRFSGEAERKLEELRRRIQGVSASNHDEDLNSIGKTSTDYYTQEEMAKFKKPKKKKSLRKKDKLDINALEAEAIASGLGVEDLGSRRDGRRQIRKEEEDRIEAETRSNAYQSALAKADEASKYLRQEQGRTMQSEEEDAPAFGDDDDELRKSLERARRIALQKQNGTEKSGSMVIKLLASRDANESASDNPNESSGDQPENKVVFTEMDEFVWSLQLDEEEKKPGSEDAVFMEEDVAPSTSDHEMMDEDGGLTDVQEPTPDETHTEEKEEEVAPDETIHEQAVGKGLGGALQLLKDRGTLKETIEWGGRNMDKKKSKLVGIVGGDGTKEIRIERTDEYGRILTPKEAFRLLSHKFHGKGPGKMKQEKRMRQYQEELKIKQMKNADTPSLSVSRMREAQAKLKAPYLVLSGNVKPGQSSDPRSGFATVETDLGGGLTPMLGDKKVEHFLNIKRKPERGDTPSPKKPKRKSNFNESL